MPSDASPVGLTPPAGCDTMRHMKTISIRELHEKTGAWVRAAVRRGEIAVSDRGVTVARLVPHVREPDVPYFAHPKRSPAFRALQASGKLAKGTDSTRLVSQDRDRSAE
jgi:antitoxin (DNA-binding transcriptional repressor) of toxin-antitoxin stability system